MADQPRFICDVMLGSLSRWLRILGFDTFYGRALDDNEIARIARQEQRIVLTRDRGLARRKIVDRGILLASNDTFGQLKEVLSAIAGNHDTLKNIRVHSGDTVREPAPLSVGAFSGHPRCTICNGELVEVDKESARNDVPEHVFLTSHMFLKCTTCPKVYWEGSHKRMIEARTRGILEEIKGAWKSSRDD